ncbi:MAG: hypothetical protein MUC88_21350 [Planctomycetes bacterium]|jgi:hypothetical protein|nr:hypothetical protein [Planctomycetota bacterium]
MRQGPEIEHLDADLRRSTLVAGGFMGADPRSVADVIDADAGELSRLGVTARELASRMREVTNQAARAQGVWTEVDPEHEAQVDEARGALPCPWRHRGRYFKRITTIRRKGSDDILRWSDLSLHMIDAHGFFEGKGSMFRVEPAALVQMLY